MKNRKTAADTGNEKVGNSSFFAMLEQPPQIGQTKVFSHFYLSISMIWYDN